MINTQPGDVDYIPIFKHNPQPQGPLELQSVNWEAGINVLDDQYVWKMYSAYQEKKKIKEKLKKKKLHIDGLKPETT